MTVRGWARWLPWSVPAASTVLFLFAVAQFYRAGTGFTSLIAFSEGFQSRQLPAVRELPLAVEPGYGYDGQFYAQIAVDPLLRTPELDRAMDLAPHRTRRILFSWTAFALGLGNPQRIITVYSVQNIVCWGILGVLILRWFPMTSWRSAALWFVTMFSGGLLWSVRKSLLDGPSLLLIAIAMVAIETRRHWWATAILGINALGRETNVLAAGTLVDPAARSGRAIGRQLLQLGLFALPIVIWFDYLSSIYRGTLFTSGSVMGPPFEWYWWRWGGVITNVGSEGWHREAFLTTLILTSLTVQAAFTLFRPRWNDPWWRLGFAYAFLMIFFGRPMWVSNPSALRVVLPLNLAFNVQLTRVTNPWFFWPLVVAGNVSMLFGWYTLEVPLLGKWF